MINVDEDPSIFSLKNSLEILFTQNHLNIDYLDNNFHLNNVISGINLLPEKIQLLVFQLVFLFLKVDKIAVSVRTNWIITDDILRESEDVVKYGKYLSDKVFSAESFYISSEDGNSDILQILQTDLKMLENLWLLMLKLQKKSDTEPIVVKLGSEILTIRRNNGRVKLNKYETEFNPISEEFQVFLKLATNKDYRASYEELIGAHSKSDIRNLTFTIRNIKKFLGILPRKRAKNKDIIENIKNYGYRLTT